MVQTGKIKGLMAEHGYSGKDMAAKLGMAPETFYKKMRRGVFGTDEASLMIDILAIEDPADIFFPRK